MKFEQKQTKYPIFSFRLSEEEKERLMKQIKDVAEAINEARPKGTKVKRQNEVIVEALTVGLKEVKRRYGK